jgi:hypothetical protein
MPDEWCVHCHWLNLVVMQPTGKLPLFAAQFGLARTKQCPEAQIDLFAYYQAENGPYKCCLGSNIVKS